jgi:hypothetical protein
VVVFIINRYYDPTTDQFLSVDPKVSQTDQPYVFAGDSPLNATDPLGDVSSTFACSGQGNYRNARARASACSSQRAVLRRYQARQARFYNANSDNHGVASVIFMALPLTPLLVAAVPTVASSSAAASFADAATDFAPTYSKVVITGVAAHIATVQLDDIAGNSAYSPGTRGVASFDSKFTSIFDPFSAVSDLTRFGE